MTDYTKDDTIDQDRMAQWEMASKLPYQLTTGVTATREGLVVIDLHLVHWLAFDVGAITGDMDGWVITWPDAAERLRYREGEPWCGTEVAWDSFGCMGPNSEIAPRHEFLLHRLAAILVDDAEGLRILWWCVNNLN